MKKNTIQNLLMLFLLVNVSCNKPCEEPLTVENASAFMITFRDSALQRHLYDFTRPLFKIDSLQISDNNNTSYRIFKEQSSEPWGNYPIFTLVYLGGIYDSRFDASAYQNVISKQLYINYGRGVKDTLNVEFKTEAATCGSQFKKLKIIYKNKIILDTNDVVSVNLIITR